MEQLSSHPARARQRGLTLIELMISITVGLIIVSALSYLYVGTRGTYRVNDNLARMQETGRFALEWISRDVRGIGFMGCLPSIEAKPLVVARPAVLFSSGADGLVGYEDGAGWPDAPLTVSRAAGDVITMRAAESASVNLDGANDVPGAKVKLASNCIGVRQGDAVFLSDCEKGYVIRVTNNPPNTCTATSSSVTIEHDAGTSTDPGNGDNGIVSGADSHKIGALNANNGAKAFRLEQKTYFIGVNPGNRRALYRVSSAGGTEEVVENVEDMDVLYGLDTDNNGSVDVYRNAGAIGALEWAQVRSVRVNLLVVSGEDSLATQQQQVIFRDTNNDGQPEVQTAGDRRLRQVFSATVAVRNRLN